MPSVSPANPFAVEAVASPSAATSAPAPTSYVVSTLDLYFQMLATLQQNVGNFISQEIAQAESDIEQLVDRLEGINPNTSHSSSSSATLPASDDSGMGRGNSSGFGSGKGAMTTANNGNNQQLNNSTQQRGNGSGSGSSATTTHPIASKHGVTLQPMTSGTGSGTGTGSGFKPQVYFGSGSYSVPESGSGSGAELEVELSAPVNKTVTVGYQTTNGTATAGTDYTTTSGTLTFPPNVTSQYITVPIIDDGPGDDNVGSETFTASLSGPNNATLGTPSTTTVQIMEQDTVNGQVWLDNNGDGLLNNGEMGYYGDSVSLYSVIDQNGDDPTLVDTVTTTTNPYGNNFQFVVPASYLPGPGPSYFEVGVGIPQDFYATKQPGDSQINSAGFSPVFPLAPGGAENIKAGLRSTVVKTTDDDPNGPLPQDQNKVSLRDAIQTVINGLDNPVTFKVSGTISLQKKLPDLSKDITIDGRGSSIIVQGNANAGNQYSIFTISGGVSSSIYNLTIEGGYAAFGGGIYNQGGLTLVDDVIQDNTATQSGGGIDNPSSASNMLLQDDVIQYNTAAAGGGIYNDGTLKSQPIDGTSILGNTATADGGGIYNLNYVQLGGGDAIGGGNTANTKTGDGGGVYNASTGTFILANGYINNNDAYQGGGLFNRGNATLSMGTEVETNSANEGGGLFLDLTSTTGLNTVTVSGNLLIGVGAKAKGIGYITGATMNFTKVTDNDDPGGQPVKLG